MVGANGDHIGVAGRSDASHADPAAVLDRIAAAVFAVDDAGRVTYANDEAAALVDVARGEFVGADARAVAGDAFVDAFERAMERQERVDVDARFDAAGERRAFSLHPSPSGVTACAREVTDEPTVETQRLRAVVESIDDVVTIKDRDGRYQLVNRAAAAALGVSKDDILGRTDRELFGEGVGRRMRERERDVLATERPCTYRERLPTADGERVYDTTCVPYYAPGGDLAGTVCVCRDVTDRLARERELRRYETLVETSPDAMFALDADLTVTLVNDAATERTGYDREAMVGEHAATLNEWGVFDDDDFEDGIEEVRRLLDPDGPAYSKFEVEQYDADGEPWLAEYHAASIGGDAGVVGVVRDVTDRVCRRRQIRRQRDELDALNRINALVHEIIGGLVEASSRDEIESTACERLADSAFYEAALVVERDGGELTARATAGDDWLPRVDGDADGSAVDVALSTGETQVVADARTDERVPETVRADLLDRGYRSGVVVPLAHGSATYGALVVVAGRRDAFSDRERSAFEVLGETVAFAVNAAQNRRLLLGDNLVEFTFRVADSDAFFPSLADRLDCSCTLEWTVPGADDRVLLYVSVVDTTPDDALAVARADDRVCDARVLGDGDDATLFEIAVEESTPSRLLEVGANPTAVTAEPGSARVTVEAPPSVDLDAVMDAFEASHDDTELVAKREVGRSTHTTAEFRESVEDRVTDRQRAVLQAAYHAGYFAWPRDSSAEDLAATLGVSSATVHYHLRRAEHALVSAFLDE